MKSRRKIPTAAAFTDGKNPAPPTMAVDARPSAGDVSFVYHDEGNPNDEPRRRLRHIPKKAKP